MYACVYYVYLYVCIVCVYVRRYACVYACMYVCIHACVHGCMHECMEVGKGRPILYPYMYVYKCERDIIMEQVLDVLLGFSF